MEEKVKLTPKLKKELDDIIEVIQTEADNVKLDYEQNPSNLDSCSVIVVHQDSTLLDNKDEELSDIAYNIQHKTNIQTNKHRDKSHKTERCILSIFSEYCHTHIQREVCEKNSKHSV